MMQATQLFAGLLALFYLYLSARVIGARRKFRVPYGTPEGQSELMRAVRAHGNFFEYTPLFLILLGVEETSYHLHWLCYILGAFFLAGRLANAYSLLIAEPKGMEEKQRARVTFRFRFYAVVHTFFTIGLLAVMLLVQWGVWQIIR